MNQPVCLTPPCGVMPRYHVALALGAKLTEGDSPEQATANQRQACADQGKFYDPNTDSCYTQIPEGESVWSSEGYGPSGGGNAGSSVGPGAAAITLGGAAILLALLL